MPIEFRTTATDLEWRHAGTGGAWQVLLALSTVTAAAAAEVALERQRAILDGIIRSRSWPTRPSFSTIAENDQTLPAGLTFTRAGTAYRINSKGILESVAAGAIRHDYNPSSGAYRGWLLEAEATNVIRRSTDPTFAVWTLSNATVALNQVTGVAGTLTAHKLTEIASNTAHALLQTNTYAPSQSWTWSVFAKAAGRNWIRIQAYNNSAVANVIRANFQLTGGGTVAREIGGGTATNAKGRITPHPDGWYLCEISGVPDTSGTQIEVGLNLLNGDVADVVYTGDGASGVYFEFPQLETGYRRTSPINTVGAAVTRVADTLTTSGLGTWFNPAQGALYLEFSEPYLISTDRVLAKFSDGTVNNFMEVYVSSIGRVKFRVVTGGVEQASFGTQALTAGGTANRVLAMWEANNFGLCVNSAAVENDYAGTVPTVTSLALGGAARMHLLQAAAFIRRPSDSEAQTFTGPDRTQVADDALYSIATVEGFVLAEVDDEGVWRDFSLDDLSGTAVPKTDNLITGALKSTSFKVSYDIVNADVEVKSRVQVATDTAFASPVYTSALTSATTRQSESTIPYLTFAFEATGLTANTQYYGRVEINGNWGPQSFSVKTLVADGTAAAMKFVFISCQDVRSRLEDASEFRAMATEAAHMLVHTGDLHYGNIIVNDLRRQRSWMRSSIGHKDMQAGLAALPMAYMPDDHDMGPNNVHRQMVIPNTTALQILNNSQVQYDEMIPHYTLVQPGTTFPSANTVLTQTFTTANFANILLDARSQRDHQGLGASATLIGTGTVPAGSWDQKTWLKGQLTAAGAAGRAAVLLWSPAVWGTSADGWSELANAEYLELATYIRDTPGIPQVYLFVGDVHHLEVDDGTRISALAGAGITVPQFLSSGAHLEAASGHIMQFRWNGAVTLIYNRRGYMTADLTATGAITVRAKGEPFDPVTFAPTLLGTFASTDATPAVRFAAASGNASANSTVNISVLKSWFGPVGPLTLNGNTATASVAWSAVGGQAGTLFIRPNCGTYTIPVVAPASGSRVVTLSAPTTGLALGAQTTYTINVV